MDLFKLIIDKKGLLGLLLFILLNLKLTAQMNNADLEGKIKEKIGKCDGEVAVAFKRLDIISNPILINADHIFHAASTMKTPVMLQIIKLIEGKKLRLEDKVLVKNVFKSIVDSSDYSLSLADDSDDVLYKKIGQYSTIEDLVYLMMTVSSNLATNLLIELCGPENIMQTLENNNIGGIKILRGVEDNLAFKAGLNNTTTAMGMLQLFEYLDGYSNQETKALMMKILLEQKFKDIIPAQLPKNVIVAHKTGSITGVQHDTGIVYLADGKKYILILLSKNLKNEKEGIKILSDISKLIYDFVKN
jgi:beta-lactamase class A